MFKMLTKEEFKNAKPFTTFQFAAIMVVGLALGWFAIGCGGDTACENGSCDQGQIDAGTAGDNNPITGKDGGTPDGGDVTSGDAGGGDTEPADPCKGYEWFNETFKNCQSASGLTYDVTCQTRTEGGKCWAKCEPLGDFPVDNPAVTYGDNQFTYTSPSKTVTCPK